jgi:hypothetical protein
MAIGRSTGLFLLALASAFGCGGSPPSEPQTPAAATAAGESASSEPAAQPETPAEEAPASDTKPAAGSDDKWEGEEEAVGKPVPRTKDETRTTPVIQQTILANRKPVRDCYDKARKELPDLKGTMTITLVLDPDGKVKTAALNVERSDIKSPAVVNCSIDALKKIKFPPSSRGMDTTVNYPFDFKPDGAR